jgi:hypothetical protein
VSVWPQIYLQRDVILELASFALPASELTQLVALVRRVCGLDGKLIANEDRVRRNFQNWILKRHSGAGEKFNEEKLDWLRLIRDHIATSLRIERDDLDFSPFDAKGGVCGVGWSTENCSMKKPSS